jgi:hypothetical protein
MESERSYGLENAPPVKHRERVSHTCTSAIAVSHTYTVEIRYSGTNNVYKTKSFRCQNSGTRL